MRDIQAFLDARLSQRWPQWAQDPLSATAVLELSKFLAQVPFAVENIVASSQTGLYPIAKLLGVQVPDRSTNQQVEIAPGLVADVTWGSINGRATEWVSMSFSGSSPYAVYVLSRLVEVLKPERVRDLSLVVQSRRH